MPGQKSPSTALDIAIPSLHPRSPALDNRWRSFIVSGADRSFSCSETRLVSDQVSRLSVFALHKNFKVKN
jgi:hypothetical protein